jgi:pantoate--beta-alanine ligase
VATVVAKLFALAGPCRAYFGEKDFQQLAVVRTMVRDLCLPVEIVPRPTVREDDGLALSSRNRRLDGPDRAAATVLWRALQAGRAAVAAGTADPGAVERVMAEVIGAEPRAALEYTACVDPADFTPAPLGPGSHARLLVAARVGPVRLIDNCAAAVPAGIPAGAGGRATAGET